MNNNELNELQEIEELKKKELSYSDEQLNKIYRITEEDSEEEYEAELPLRLKDNSLSAIQIAAIRRVYAYNGADLEIVKVGGRRGD